MAKRLVLIDGHAIIHRAYHALPPLTSSSGQLVNAVYGFVSMLLRVVDELKPTHLVVAFDLPGPTFRHEAYIAYQAKRPVMDEELSGQIGTVHEVVEAAGIPIYTSPGFEADDVIGTLAEQAAGIDDRRSKVEGRILKMEGRSSIHPQSSNFKSPPSSIHRPPSKIEVIIVTGDRDILQLVGEKVKVYMTIRGLTDAKMFGEKEVEEYMGIKASQIVDYKALIGDASDNYPGVPGIGPKTAQSLLEQFGTLKKIYEAIELKSQKSKVKTTTQNLKVKEISAVIIDKLRDGYEGAMLSQKLAQIRIDAPVELDLGKAELGDLSKNEKFIAKLSELRFKSLVGRLGGPAYVPPGGTSARLAGAPAKRARQGKTNGQMGLL